MTCAVSDTGADKLLAQHRGSGAQSAELGQGDIAGEGRHSAVGARNQFVGIHILQRLAQGFCDLFRGFNLLVGHVDGAKHDSFAAHQLHDL